MKALAQPLPMAVVMRRLGGLILWFAGFRVHRYKHAVLAGFCNRQLRAGHDPEGLPSAKLMSEHRFKVLRALFPRWTHIRATGAGSPAAVGRRRGERHVAFGCDSRIPARWRRTRGGGSGR